MGVSKMNFEEYSNRIYYPEYKISPLLEEILKKRKLRNVLDVGCGDGTLLVALFKKSFVKPNQVYGVDISKKRVSRLLREFPEFNLKVDNSQSLNKIRKNFDLILSTQVIEHVPDESKMICAITKKLNKNGYLYLSTVFKKKWAWYFYRCNGKWRLDPTHLREYESEGDLINKLKEYGLKILSTKKTLMKFPLIDPFLRIFKISSFNAKKFNFLRKIKMPILGYYEWEILCKKN